MIYWYEPTREQKDSWRESLRALPSPELQQLAEQYPPWRLYKTTATERNSDDLPMPGGLRVFVGAICADGRLRILATVGLNVQLTEDLTFRVWSHELQLCEAEDLPQAEPVNDVIRKSGMVL